MTTKRVDEKKNKLPDRRQFPTIEGYRFLQTLARSARSEVYVAHSNELHRNVAVKILRQGQGPHSASDTSEEKRFERERLLLTQVRHPAVIDIYDWGHGEGFRYIVTEYFASGSLELRIRNLMSVRDSIDIFLQICGALVAVHAAGMCHRDLKPANVMMRPDGRIVLIDFGLAKNVDSGTQLTNIGEIRGSPYYISPEQAEGGAVDRRTDLYSLGVMFYEMLTGQRPFRGSSVVAIIHAHRNDPLPDLPAELSQFQSLMDGLLAKDPADRFPSAATALAALSRLKL